MQKVPEPKVFNAKSLSMRWGMKEKDVRDLVRNGELHGSYLAGKLLRISREDVLDFEQKHGLGK